MHGVVAMMLLMFFTQGLPIHKLQRLLIKAFIRLSTSEYVCGLLPKHKSALPWRRVTSGHWPRSHSDWSLQPRRESTTANCPPGWPSFALQEERHISRVGGGAVRKKWPVEDHLVHWLLSWAARWRAVSWVGNCKGGNWKNDNWERKVKSWEENAPRCFNDFYYLVQLCHTL